MKRRRRCCVCDALFMPDSRVGSRQRTCGEPACKAERHRVACKEWRDRERPAVEADRLRRRLSRSGSGESGELSREVVRDVMGPKESVVLEELFRLAVAGSRDAFATKRLDLGRESFRLVARPGEDATARAGPGP